MFRAIVAAVRRFLSRRAARKLLAQRPLRGLRVVLLAVPRIRLPARLPLRDPLASRVRDLGAADVRAFRLDPQTLAPANETILPAPSDPSYRWVQPAFRRRHLDLPWVAQERVRFLGPMQAEWFALWWDRHLAEAAGGARPREWERPEDIDWAMDVCKEQMLIRRDVKKDEEAPPEQEWSAPEIGHPLVAWDPVPLPELAPPKEWVEIADPQALRPVIGPQRGPREAYLQWRTLMESLED